MQVRDFIQHNLIYLDGAMGTTLQGRGLRAGEPPEAWNISHPEEIVAVHKAYYDAGANVVCTNTFGASVLKFDEATLEDVVRCAVQNAKMAREQSQGAQPKWIALDIGPTGRMLAPFGDLDFEEAVEVFAQTVRLGVKYGVDMIFIETMTDGYETKAAVLAAKECCDLPIFVSNAYAEDGRLMTGAEPRAVIAMLEGLGVDAIGVNCSFGPEKLAPVVREYLKYSSLPVLLKPNAGLPRVVDGRTAYDVSAEAFAGEVKALVGEGVRCVGGCCGTTPDYIEALVKATRDVMPVPVTKKDYTVVSSYSRVVEFGKSPVLIGERINPTGKKRLKEALRARDIDYVLKEGVAQEERGAHILDVNVGLPEIDEAELMTTVVQRLQAVTDLPLEIDTADCAAMERALRTYNGKAMINSVNGKESSMQTVFPLVKKYGGVVVCLTLDENGIPDSAEARLEIAKKIVSTAKKYGIDKKDLVFDPLTLTISADKNAARTTLSAVRLIREELGCHTSLGVSNVSFGLPNREIINATFFAMALKEGLSAAIMNPLSTEMMKVYHSYKALVGQDENCADYLDFAESVKGVALTDAVVRVDKSVDISGSELFRAITKGFKDEARRLSKEMLNGVAPLDLVEKEIIPALNAVGEGFENKTIYLPQLLTCAEAAQAAFEVVKANMQGKADGNRCSVVLATVQGDVHDIGKNIVKLLLENYGFAVTDLGKDVSPERICREVVKLNAPILGLSALMTTTVPAMGQTIALIRQHAPWCKVVVGGAVLTEDYAQKLGADKYARDAMATVRYAEEIEKAMRT